MVHTVFCVEMLGVIAIIVPIWGVSIAILLIFGVGIAVFLVFSTGRNVHNVIVLDAVHATTYTS